VDFACVDARVIVELDGGQHAEARDKTYDERRDNVLRAEGWHVLRFWNDDVLLRTPAVLEMILANCEAREGCEIPNPLTHGPSPASRARGEKQVRAGTTEEPGRSDLVPSPACGRGKGEGFSKRELWVQRRPSPPAPLPLRGRGEKCGHALRARGAVRYRYRSAPRRDCVPSPARGRG
jgi:hypothetical protein